VLTTETVDGGQSPISLAAYRVCIANDDFPFPHESSLRNPCSHETYDVRRDAETSDGSGVGPLDIDPAGLPDADPGEPLYIGSKGLIDSGPHRSTGCSSHEHKAVDAVS
jgi:hypothetical protein